MVYVQKVYNFIIIPSSQTLRSTILQSAILSTLGKHVRFEGLSEDYEDYCLLGCDAM
jgi:hypothetical protein